MDDRSRARTLTGVAAAAALMAGLVAPPVLAAGNGLPRTYNVQRIDSPQPEDSGLFSLSLNVAGDLNGDGRQDLISPQVAGFNTQGRVYVFSGADGGPIDTITAPDPSGVGANAQFGLLGTGKVGVNRSSAPFSDLGSCPGGSSGATCPGNPIGQPDGIPDLLIGATGVDVGGVTDVGRVYVIDGATRAVLKRIDMPVADRSLTAGPAGFGREVLAPEGLPGCEGNSGIGPCEVMPLPVRIGDMDGAGRPDIVVGARRVNETPATAALGSHCAAAVPTATCRAAGRAYIYRGEDIVGSNPGEILDGTGPGETVRTIRNPDAQADDPQSAINTDSEGFGNDLMPIGDVGRCNNAALAPGDTCPRADSSTTLDDKPEVLVMAPGEDYPLAAPDPAFSETGAAYLIDGATGTILHTYLHPEPQRAGAFGGSFEHSIAAGDMGDTGLPDAVLGAPGQNTAFTASGRAYVMSGNFRTSASLTNIARLDDPTPDVTEENFGGSSAGVGDLVPGADAPRNELIVGASGPRVGPFVNAGHPLDVSFFNPSTERVLQIVRDPDAQTSSAFGDSIEPLGDLNDDGFLDFGVGAFRYVGANGTTAGRFYIFRSDNSPAPASAAGSAATPNAPPNAPLNAPLNATPAVTVAGRTVTLTAKARSIRAGGAAALDGRLTASASAAACVGNQEIELQRRAAGESGFTTFARVQTAADGSFARSDEPKRATRYRALVAATAECLSASSEEVAVAVVPIVRLVTKHASLPGSRTLKIRLSCPASGAACRGAVTVRTKNAVRRAGRSGRTLTLGTTRYRITAGSGRTLQIRVTRANARALRSPRPVPLVAVVTNRDADGNTLSSRGSLTISVR